jgi:hypothetical protein
MRSPMGPKDVLGRGRTPLFRRLRILLLFCSLFSLAVGCEHETALIDPTVPQDTADGDGGVVQKADLIITIVVTGEDSVLASVLGHADGVLPGAEVTIERSGTAGSQQSGVTDAAGQVRFEDLLEGRYSVSVIRLLTAEETALFGSEDADVNAFGGGVRATLVPPAMEVAVQAVAGRRGSLVISEISIPIARLTSGLDYMYGQFIELYNNSDTTIYLDGKIIVLGAPIGTRDYSTRSCEETEPLQADPEGIWTQREIEAFPGSGRTYRLEPGQAVVVATDAIDHREMHSGLQDLSGAKFEFKGTADVDNPSAANMLTLGRVFGGGILTHGQLFNIIDPIVLVADPVDVNSLPRWYSPYARDAEHAEYWRIPGEKILDVLSASPTPEQEANMTFLSPQCPRYTHENFDRRHAPLLDPSALNGIQRKVFTTLPDGRKILLRTKTSARDFRAGRATPGEIRG